MATGKSGSYTLTGSKAGITAQISWAEVYNAIKNQSDYVSVSMKVKSSQYVAAYWLNGTIKVNGATIIEFKSVMGSHVADLLAKNSYYSVKAKGDYAPQPWKSGAIAHSSDGSKSVTIAIAITGYTSSGSNGSGWTINNTKTITLTDIDRDAPSVTFKTSSITTNSFAISASASTTCDRFDYSLDNGSTWTNFSTASGTSASKTITGLTVNTSYQVKVRARRSYNQVYGTSGAKAVKTLGHALVNSCAAFAADASTVQIKPNVTVYEAGFSYYLVLKDGSTQIFKTSAISWPAGKATRTVSLTAAQRNAILKAMSKVKSKSFTLVVETYSGSTLVGSTSKSVTANTSAANSAPTFSGFTFLDSSSLTAVTGNNQILIQGYSSLKVTATAATAKNESSISNYTATIANKSVKASGVTLNVGTVDSSGSLDLTVSAIDSRGYTTSVTKKVKILPYAKPKLQSITLRRANGIDATVQLSFRGTMSTIVPAGSDVNSIASVTYKYKATDADSYSSAVAITSQTERSSNGTSFSFQTNELLSLDVNKSYDFQLSVSDKVTKYTGDFVLPKGIPMLAVRKDKLGINNPDPQYTLDVGGDINLTGNIYINGVPLSEVLGL